VVTGYDLTPADGVQREVSTFCFISSVESMGDGIGPTALIDQPDDDRRPG
jgi:hypothetical protein